MNQIILPLPDSMTSHSKLYFSDNFSIEKAKHYTLLIQIRNTDFSFAVVHQNALLAWGKNYPLAGLATSNELDGYLHSADYHKVIIGITPQVFNLVPKQLFSEGRLADFMRMLDVQPDEKAYSQTLDEDNLVLFKYSNELLPLLTAKYPYHQIVFAYKGWLQVIAGTNPAWTNLYLDVQPGEVHFAYYKNNKLRFYNSFNYTGPDELIYFTSLTAKELQLNAINTRLMISGDVVIHDKGINMLGEFFAKVDINGHRQLQQLPDGIASQQVLSLTALM